MEENKKPHRVNELSPELLALHSLNPFSANNAPARGTMFASHFAQRVVFDGSEPSLIQTGNEDEFGKYTFSIKMPEDGTILRVIPRYQPNASDDSINFNPETIVIFRGHESGVVDYFTLPYHLSNHPQFGFKYELKPAANEIAVGKAFAKDTVFADSPAVKEESHYTYGKNVNVVYMSHPNVGLDGFVINRDLLKDFKFRIYETRTISVGSCGFPLNLLGDDEEYKAFPDIGEYVREDGLLMVTRRFDPYLTPAVLGKSDLRNVDYLFDNKIFTRPGKGKVVDIVVIKTDNVNRQLPPEMTKQLERYSRANERFHNEIIKVEESLIKESYASMKEGKIEISQQLQRLLVMAKGTTNYHGNKHKQPLKLTYKREPLDTWRITFTIEYEVIPDRGFKFTCTSGGGPKI